MGKKRKSAANLLFDKVVADVIRELPSDLREALGTVQVVVQDKPDPSLLKRTGPKNSEDLFGVFDGLSLREWPLGRERYQPDRIILFKQALQKAFPQKGNLAAEIRTTLIHELGHYFGFTEKELRERGWG